MQLNKNKVIKLLGITAFLLLMVIPLACKTNKVEKSKKISEVNYIPYYLKVNEAVACTLSEITNNHKKF